jgi:hypothetical protein
VLIFTRIERIFPLNLNKALAANDDEEFSAQLSHLSPKREKDRATSVQINPNGAGCIAAIPHSPALGQGFCATGTDQLRLR